MADELSLTELAILMMTNDPLEISEKDPRREPIVLTSKESYFWSVALAMTFEEVVNKRVAAASGTLDYKGGWEAMRSDFENLAIDIYREVLTESGVLASDVGEMLVSTASKNSSISSPRN